MQNIYQSISAIMSEVEAIGKNKKNTMQNFMYRGIDDMYNDLQPKFSKHKVFVTSEVIKCSREERPSKSGGLNIWTILKVRFTFYAEDGSSISNVMIGEAMDSGDKGANKAMSVALKYCLIQLFLIPTEDAAKDDNDGHISQPAASQLPKKEAAAKAANKQEPQVDMKEWETVINDCKNVEELSALKKDNLDAINTVPGLGKLFLNHHKKLTAPATQINGTTQTA